MRSTVKRGFTLVEILIVVVILGILAAIVVPQFANASQDAIKGALASQLQTVNSQIELYRVQNAGALPHTNADPVATGGNEGGWGVLVAQDFLKDEPNNGYTGTSTVAVSATAAGTAAPVAFAAGAVGWQYSSTTGEVVATGFNHDLNLLSNETGYAAVTF